MKKLIFLLLVLIPVACCGQGEWNTRQDFNKGIQIVGGITVDSIYESGGDTVITIAGHDFILSDIRLSLSISDTATMLANYAELSEALLRADTAAMLLTYITRGDTSAMLSNYAELSEALLRVDTAAMLANYAELSEALLRVDTSAMLTTYITRGDTSDMLATYLKINNSGFRIGDSIGASYNRLIDSVVLNATDTAIYTKAGHRIPIGLSVPTGSGSGAVDFLDLTDTPSNYTDDSLFILTVNATEDAVQFANQVVITDHIYHDNGAMVGDSVAGSNIFTQDSVTNENGVIIMNSWDGNYPLNADTTIYYVDATNGNDANHGHDPDNALQSITAVNTLTLYPGDQVLFKRGDTFYGSIVISQSGTSTKPITFGAYGTGADPVITGFTTVTGWTDELDGTYSKAITVPSDSQTNVVVVDDVMTGMGRYPDVTYLTYEYANENIDITDTGLGDSPDWEGAEAVIRKNDWGEERCLITDHTVDVITYSNIRDDAAQWWGTDNYGYFIQNDIRTLTTANEWFHDTVSGANTLYIYGDPAAKEVKVATIDYLFYNYLHDYITIENISFTGSIVSGVYFRASDDCIVQNCDISYTGEDGIFNFYSDNTTIDSNTISETGRAGIRNQGGADLVITNNTINKAGFIKGVAYDAYLANGILHGGAPTGGLIQYNNIDSSAYHGIGFYGDGAEVRNNFINHSLINYEDGGGIYTSSTYTNRIIDGNIILNTIGNMDGTYGATSNASGIYLDAANGDDVTVTNNTVAHSTGRGIQINQTTDHTITDNLLFDNKRGILITNLTGAPDIASYTIEDNIFFAKGQYQHAFMAYANTADYPDYASLNNNYYLRPIDDDDVFFTWDITTQALDSMTLGEWQTLTGEDAGSSGSPWITSDTSNLDFYYNASQVSREFVLPYPAMDATGTMYFGSITLAPYTSAALISRPDYSQYVFNVRDYGATGDGATDDITAINTALTAADGKTLYFPAGTYVISEDITAAVDNVTIRGDGPQASIIYLESGANDIMLTTGGDGWIIEDIGFNGNDAGNTGTCHGISIGADSATIIRNCEIWDVEDIAISVAGNCREVKIVDNKLIDSAFGVDANDGDDILIHRNRFISCTTPIDIDDVDVTRAIVMANNWYGCTNDMASAAATNPLITDNVDKSGAWFATDDK